MGPYDDHGAPSDEKPMAPGIELEPGQRVSATVVEMGEGGRVLVGLRGIRIEAFTRVPLEPGRTYTFLVEADGDRVRLSLDSPRKGGRNRPGPGGLIDVKG